MARISFHGGALFVPVKTPYERELLFEHVDLYTKRHGQVLLELDQREWTVRRANDHPELCTTCGRRLDLLSYALGERTLCSQCVRRDIR